jgi:hypothetical protein
MLETSDNSLNPGQAWSAEQVAFQRWLALPRKVREPRLRSTLAEELGVSVRTLCRWERLPGWDEAVRALVKAEVFESVLVQKLILEALVRKAAQGSFTHQRLYLELAGIYNPKGVVAVAGVKVVFGVEAEEI